MSDYNRKPISRATALLALPTLLIGLLPACVRPDGKSTDQSRASRQIRLHANRRPPVDTNAVLALNDEQISSNRVCKRGGRTSLREHLRRIVGSTTLHGPFKVFRQFPFIKLNLPYPVNGHHSRLALKESVLPNLW